MSCRPDQHWRHVALIGLVMICCACTTLSEDEEDTAIRPERPTPAWTSTSPCIPGAAELMMTSEQYRIALVCSANDFQWPSGRYPDIDWIMGAEKTSPLAWNYQIGLEHVQLGNINQCAWYASWLEARKAGNEELQKEALAYMTDVIPNFAEIISGYPPDAKTNYILERERNLAAAAALGDPSGIQHFVDSTCASIPFDPHPSATPAPTE